MMSRIAFLMYFLDVNDAKNSVDSEKDLHITFLNAVLLPDDPELFEQWVATLEEIVSNVAPFSMDATHQSVFTTASGEQVPVMEYGNKNGAHMSFHHLLCENLPKGFSLGKPEFSGDNFSAHISHDDQSREVIVDSISLNVCNSDYSGRQHIRDFFLRG